MSETKWTPGPWKADGGAVYAADPTSPRTTLDGYRVILAAICMNISIEEIRANARVAAAAPELYEALTKANDVICGAGLVEEFPVWVIDLIDAALAKALGESPATASASPATEANPQGKEPTIPNAADADQTIQLLERISNLESQLRAKDTALTRFGEFAVGLGYTGELSEEAAKKWLEGRERTGTGGDDAR